MMKLPANIYPQITMSKQKVSEAYTNHFGGEHIVVRSPGRINIIGEHTDYNNGFVLPAAIDKAAYLAVGLRDDNEIHLVACDLNETFSMYMPDLKPVGDVNWPNYILGAAAQFRKMDYPLKGFNAVLSGDVPVGAGLSSSAAVECATMFALNELLKTDLDKITMIQMAQKAEHEFAGVMCGIMDQFASMLGKKNHVIKLDCRSLQHEYIPLDLSGYRILLFNTNVKHSLASSEYNTRRKECCQAVQWIKKHESQVHSLRDVTEIMLDKYVKPKSGLIDKRSRFAVQEINRLLAACEDLKNADMISLGKKMYATHDGLSSMYEVSCKELDFLVDIVRDNPAVIGARMMGGGFGGCTINLVKEEKTEAVAQIVKHAYEMAMQLPLTIYTASTADGTSVIS